MKLRKKVLYMRKSNLYNVYVGNEKAHWEGTWSGFITAGLVSIFLIPLVLPIYLGYKVITYLYKRVNEEIEISRKRSSVLDQQFEQLSTNMSGDKFSKAINSTSLAQFSEKINSISGIVQYYSDIDFEEGAKWLEATYACYIKGKYIPNPTEDYSNSLINNLVATVCKGNLPLLGINTNSLKYIKTNEQGLFLPPVLGLTNKCIVYKYDGKRITFKETTFIIKQGNITSSVDDYKENGNYLNRQLAFILTDISKALITLKNLNTLLERNKDPKKGILFKEEAYDEETKQCYKDQLHLLFAYYKLLLEESLVGVNNLYTELINMNNELMK